MLFRLALSVVFISLTTFSFATEIHIQAGCIDISVGYEESTISCACIPDNSWLHPWRCKYKDYNTGQYTTKVTIFDPPCNEDFEFPTKYAKVFYTIDGCLRAEDDSVIHCCPRRPFQYPYTCPEVGGSIIGGGCSPSPRRVSLNTIAIPDEDEEPSFSSETPLNKEMASTDVNAQDSNAISLSDTTTEMVDLGSAVVKRGNFVKPYRINRQALPVGR